MILAYIHKFFNDKLLLALAIVSFMMIFGDMFMANSYKRVLWVPTILFISYTKQHLIRYRNTLDCI